MINNLTLRNLPFIVLVYKQEGNSYPLGKGVRLYSKLGLDWYFYLEGM